MCSIQLKPNDPIRTKHRPHTAAFFFYGGCMNDMLDTKDIASMLGVTRAHCVGRIVKRPDFPKPAVSVSQRIKRWRKNEVLKWMGLVK